VHLDLQTSNTATRFVISSSERSNALRTNSEQSCIWTYKQHYLSSYLLHEINVLQTKSMPCVTQNIRAFGLTNNTSTRFVISSSERSNALRTNSEQSCIWTYKQHYLSSYLLHEINVLQTKSMPCVTQNIRAFGLTNNTSTRFVISSSTRSQCLA
jgi:hypothetical protein